MLKSILICCLAVVAIPVIAVEEDDGAQYRGWCTRSAKADKVAADEREDYIRECMSTLAEADRNPDRSRRKGKGGKDDEA